MDNDTKSEPVSVGYVCRRGHIVLYGDPDNACESKAEADVLIIPRNWSDTTHEEFEMYARVLAERVGLAWRLLDQKQWDEYEAQKAAQKEDNQ